MRVSRRLAREAERARLFVEYGLPGREDAGTLRVVMARAYGRDLSRAGNDLIAQALARVARNAAWAPGGIDTKLESMLAAVVAIRDGLTRVASRLRALTPEDEE